MALFVLPKVLSDLVKSFKAASNGKVLAKSGDIWAFQDPQSGPQGVKGDTGSTGATGPGVPAGGAAGQTLSKINGTDFNTQWADPTSLPPPVDLTSAVADYTLPIGGSAIITFSAAVSVPLHINTAGGEYEIIIQGNTTTAIGTQAAVSLTANNTTYAAGSFKLLNFGANAAFTDAPGIVSPQTFYRDMATYTKLALSFSLVVRLVAKINTATTSKAATVQGIALRTGPSMWFENYGIYWNDTTTVWSSLGTIEFPFAQSGKILIRRLV